MGDLIKVNGIPAPQYKNPATGNYEDLEGAKGGLKANLVGSIPSIQTFRNQIVNAGAYFTCASFLATDGVKRVTAGVRADASHSMQFYVNHSDATGAILFGQDSVGAVVQTYKTLDYTVKASKASVTYQNTDTVAHTINVDVIGWPN